MAKKKQNIQLEGLADLDFKKEPDIEAAQSIIAESAKEKQKAEPKPPAPKKPRAKKAKVAKREPTPPAQVKSPRSTFPPAQKKRATFNIDEDLHRALKDYSYFEEMDMVEYIFETLVKPDLAKKGYYPPKKRR